MDIDDFIVLVLAVLTLAATVVAAWTYVETQATRYLVQAGIAAVLASIYGWDLVGLPNSSGVLYVRIVGVAWIASAGIWQPFAARRTVRQIKKAARLWDR
jgi:hypothetical protein